LRLPISTSSPSRKITDLKPSHFGSYIWPAGMSATGLASIGATGGMTGRSTTLILLGRPRTAQARATRGIELSAACGRLESTNST
jgi:hypothetical protein